jgi:hypothetical protein
MISELAIPNVNPRLERAEFTDAPTAPRDTPERVSASIGECMEVISVPASLCLPIIYEFFMRLKIFKISYSPEIW